MIRGIYNHFNRGEIDSRMLARDDVERARQSGSYVKNFRPEKFGPMNFREGTEMLGVVPGISNFLGFIAATDDTALLELTDEQLRVWVDDALVARTSVTTTVTNGTFDANITSWTDVSGTGSVAVWKTGGYASLTGAISSDAILHQTLTTETGEEHGLRIIIVDGPVEVSLGTTGAESTDIFHGALDPGTHSLVFTPDSNVTITLRNPNTYESLVDSVAIEGAGTLTLPLDIAEADLPSARFIQSADVVFIAHTGGPPFKIERRGAKSWSVSEYRAESGPYGLINSTKITLDPTDLVGNTTLTASQDYFTSDHIGQLFKVGSLGQRVEVDGIASDNTGTNNIRVTGSGYSTRNFKISITVSGWTGTVTLQRSTDGESWVDVNSWTTNYTDSNYDDDLDGSVLFYRLWVSSGDYAAGTADVYLRYNGGSIDGECRVLSITSPTAAEVQVLEDFGWRGPSVNWYAGEWSEVEGYPTSVSVYEGRLWWAGRNRIWGTESDSFYSFDTTLEGNSASIRRTIGFGPVDTVQWLEASNRLIMGLASDEISVRSTSFGELLSKDNTNLKSGSTLGSSSVGPIKLDNAICFVQRYGKKVYELAYEGTTDSHVPLDQTKLNPQIVGGSITKMAVVRHPESQVWCLIDDGTVLVHVRDRGEEVSAWVRFETDGTIEDVVVKPGSAEDTVYLVVIRNSVRYLERKSLTTSAQGGTVSEHFDSFVRYTSPGTTITGLSHLEGDTVGVWGDGQDRGDFTVSGGSITVGSSWTDVIVGLRYEADWISNKLGGFVASSVLGIRKRIVDVSLILENMEPGAIKMGPSWDLLSDFPLIEDGTSISQTATQETYHELPFEFDGEDEVDPRIYIRATGPCAIMALLFGIKGKMKPTQDAGARDSE